MLANIKNTLYTIHYIEECTMPLDYNMIVYHPIYIGIVVILTMALYITTLVLAAREPDPPVAQFFKVVGLTIAAPGVGFFIWGVQIIVPLILLLIVVASPGYFIYWAITKCIPKSS